MAGSSLLQAIAKGRVPILSLDLIPRNTPKPKLACGCPFAPLIKKESTGINQGLKSHFNLKGRSRFSIY